VHALINLYEDRTFLAACLESIKDSVDSIIVADGAYDLYYQRYKTFVPEAEPYSTDGSIEILQNFRGLPDLKILHNPEGKDKCWVNQALKRTALVDAVPVGDWFLIVDADDMVAGDLQEGIEHTIESGCIVGNCPLYNPGTQMERLIHNWHPRLFKKTDGMRYLGTHWHLRDKHDRIIEEKYPMYWTDIYALMHLKAFKDQTRLIPHSNYMLDLMNRGWIEPRDVDEVLLTIKNSERLVAGR
jgi:hypothetical protein